MQRLVFDPAGITSGWANRSMIRGSSRDRPGLSLWRCGRGGSQAGSGG